MNERIHRAGFAGITGGGLWALIPLLDDLYRPYLKGLAVVPVLLILAVYGLRSHYRDDLSWVAPSSLVIGFGLLAVAALWYAYAATVGGHLGTIYLIAMVAIPGLVLVGIGSLLLAYRLRTGGHIARWTAVLFALALPLDPLFNALVTPLFGAGLSLYGLAWVAFGHHLWHVPDPDDGVQAARTSGNTAR